MKSEALVEAARHLFKRVPNTDKARYYLGLVEGKHAQLNVSDGSPLYIEIKEGKIQVHEGSIAEPDWTMEACTAVYEAIFKAQIPMTMAVGVDRLSLSGRGALLGPLVTMCQEEFRKALLESAEKVSRPYARDYV